MKDIKLNMQGERNTFIDLNKSVQDHDALAQSCLMLSVTVKGSDALFEDKGTDLIAGTTNINIINNNYQSHLSNYAALSILNFLNNRANYNGDIRVSDVDMDLINQSLNQESIKFYQIVYFSDGTQTQQITNI